MVERMRSKREGRVERRGGYRKGAGRKVGSIPEVIRVARARAAREGRLPHELLLEWARTGRMQFVSLKNGKSYSVALEPSDRIACAKGCAAWFKPAFQSRAAPGEQPPVVRLELDQKTLTALAKSSPDKLAMFREVLAAIQAGGGEIGQAALQAPAPADASRYGRMLSETSDVEGRA